MFSLPTSIPRDKTNPVAIKTPIYCCPLSSLSQIYPPCWPRLLSLLSIFPFSSMSSLVLSPFCVVAPHCSLWKVFCRERLSLSCNPIQDHLNKAVCYWLLWSCPFFDWPELPKYTGDFILNLLLFHPFLICNHTLCHQLHAGVLLTLNLDLKYRSPPVSLEMCFSASGLDRSHCGDLYPTSPNLRIVPSISLSHSQIQLGTASHSFYSLNTPQLCSFTLPPTPHQALLISLLNDLSPTSCFHSNPVISFPSLYHQVALQILQVQFNAPFHQYFQYHPLPLPTDFSHTELCALLWMLHSHVQAVFSLLSCPPPPSAGLTLTNSSKFSSSIFLTMKPFFISCHLLKTPISWVCLIFIPTAI